MRKAAEVIIVSLMSAGFSGEELATSAISFGRYRLLDLLGRGGMGQVFRAYDTQTDRTVALKLLSPELADDQEFHRRFREEARAAATLNEPHVVPIHDFGEIDGRLFVDMRLIDGVDLDRLLATERLAAPRSVGLIEQVAMALDAAHQAGLVHRDVKPSNILVGRHDFAYLIDFGLARRTDATQLTKSGQTIGTLAYMAPERFDTGAADARSDVYSLTCVLYQCLTQHRPFEGDTLERQLKGHLLSPPPQPSLADAALDPAFDDVIAIGMAKDPGQRFDSASELAAAARAALDGTSPAARSATVAIDRYETVALPTTAAPTVNTHEQKTNSSAPRPKAWTRRWWIAALIAVVVIVSGIVGAFAWRHAEQSKATETAQHVRGAVERYFGAVRDGDLPAVRSTTCGAVHERYQHYTVASWARAHSAAVQAKQYQVEAGINDVQVNGDAATANVIEYQASTPDKRTTYAFGLRQFDGRWRVCSDGR